MPLKIDFPALDRARSDLGLRLDVRTIVDVLTCPKSVERTFVAGRYTGIDPFHGWHNVYVNERQTTPAASASLWHELTHAMQCERLGSWLRFDAEYQRQVRDLAIPYGAAGYWTAYRDMPLEAEAWAATELARAGQLEMLVYACD